MKLAGSILRHLRSIRPKYNAKATLDWIGNI
jgi:hypothetical protein